MIPRRTLLMSGMALPALLAFQSALSQNLPPVSLGSAILPEPGWRRVQLGQTELLALNDGVLRRPLGEEFVRNAPLESVKALLASQGLPTDYIDVPYNTYLIVDQGVRILMDTGFADNGPPGTGRLSAHLNQAGLRLEDIDVVLISHFHGDHISGLRRKDGSLTFPNAKVWVPQPEFDYWMSDERMVAAPQAARGGFLNVRRVFSAMPTQQLHRFEPGAELMSGMRSIAAFGHSPGHTLFQWKAGAEGFTYMADASHYPALFVRNPDWQVQFDMDAESARQSRRVALQRAVDQGGLVGGFHFPFPGWGRIAPEGNGYVFQPA
jgi:glyoxylase-like metal-dependent hydrolase (beta-lactamase superfamily II)